MESEHPTLLLTHQKQKQALEAEKGGAAAQARFFPSAWHPVTFTPHGRSGIINKNFAGDLFRKVIPNETEAEWPLVQLLAPQVCPLDHGRGCFASKATPEVTGDGTV